MSTENNTATETKHFYTKEEMAKNCQKNDWLKRGGYDFEDDPGMEEEYGYSLFRCSSIEQLEQKIGQGNWSIRQGFSYDRLLFVNQVNGGDEWNTSYKHEDGRIEDFESITFRRIIEDGEFKDLINKLLQGPDIYWERDKEKEGA
ncbi:hypothetical protein ABWK22_01685 [Gottfriedia acidiceleris]|uniref:hypothetical protein n=1 Tax=Gottfriedia acidiceleris TaxID=371036 RepID=UPI0033958137